MTCLYLLVNGRSAGSGRRIASVGRKGGGTAQRVSSPPAAVAASPVDAMQAGGGIEGFAVRALDTLWAGGLPGELPCAPLAPPPPCLVPRTAETAAALVVNPARPSAQMAVPAAPALMDAPWLLSRPPFSRRRPQPSPTLTRTPRLVPRLYGRGRWRGRSSSGRPARQNSSTTGTAAASDDTPRRW